VRWTVTVLDQKGHRQLFAADGMFVRVLGAPGTRAPTVFADGYDGRYRAVVRVPKGGLRGIQLGLGGWAMDAKGTRPTYGLFPVTNNPFRTTNSPSR